MYDDIRDRDSIFKIDQDMDSKCNGAGFVLERVYK